MANFTSPLNSALGSASSFARGWATMKFQLDQQAQADERWNEQFKLQTAQADMSKAQFEFQKQQALTVENQWTQTYNLNKDKVNQDLMIANRERDRNWTQWQAGEGLRKAQTTLAQAQAENAEFQNDMRYRVQEETTLANEHLMGLVPALLDTPSDQIGKVYIQHMAEIQTAFPNADISKFQDTLKIVADSKMFNMAPSKLSAATHDYIDEHGKQRTQFFYANGDKAQDLEKGEWSEGVKVLTKEWRNRLQTRREEMLKAFAAGNAAKFGGELNIAIEDLNDISANFHSIVGFADRLVSWLDGDKKTAKMRTEFDQSLSSEIKNEKSRAMVVESIFGPTPTIGEEAREAVITRYSKAYADQVQKELSFDPTTNSAVMGALLYNTLLRKYSGQERDMHIASLTAGMERTLSPSEFEDFLAEIDYEAQMYLDEMNFVGPPMPTEDQWGTQDTVDSNLAGRRFR